MKFERKHRNIILISIAVFFILYGFLDMVLNLNVSEELEDKVSWVLTIIAVALLFSGTKPKFNNFDGMNNSIEQNSGDNAVVTDNSIADASEVNGVETSDKVIGVAAEQENSSDTEIKDN